MIGVRGRRVEIGQKKKAEEIDVEVGRDRGAEGVWSCGQERGDEGAQRGRVGGGKQDAGCYCQSVEAQ